MQLKEAIIELRKQEKRKFAQSFDAIVNLKGIDLRRENINVVVNVPHKLRDKKVCGFLNAQSSLIKTITKIEFPKYKDKKPLKDLIKNYDFFIASAPLMPSVAAAFGKVLGPAGKMPSPQLGIINQETDAVIKNELNKISKAIKIRVKEASIKTSIGNESMSDEEVIANFKAFYEGVLNALPKKKEGIRNVMIKLTMAKPIKLEL